MFSILILAGALSMFAPMDKTESPDPACSDTIYVFVYRHIEWDQPIPVMVDDSVKIYEPWGKP
jgi:hypothetical protein